ncbi:hypothetical protein [Microcystis sp. M169S2]|nr:hypothetical protein [Microcystis sp. M169S2]
MKFPHLSYSPHPTSPRPHVPTSPSPLTPDNPILVTAPKLYNKGSSVNKQ